MKRQTTLYLFVTLLAAIGFAAFTATSFPNVYRSMEEDDLWLLTMDFWRTVLIVAPALTTWLADFMVQFYGTPAVAATVQALLLTLVALLAGGWVARISGPHRWLRWLGLLPALALGYGFTFNTCLLLQTLFFFALLLAYTSIRRRRLRLLFGYLSALAGYLLMDVPMIAVMVVAMMLQERFLFHTRVWKVQWPLLPMLYFIPILYSAQVAFIPFEHRYSSMWTQFVPLSDPSNRYGERVRGYIHLAEDGQWAQLLNAGHCRTDAYRGDPNALRFALLAESALGTLPDNITSYPIQEENSFLFPHERTYVTTQFNRLFYRNLGVYDECFHQAQEYGLLQRGGICFLSLRHMAEYSIAEGEWEVADKYLAILDKSMTHKDYTAQKRREMEEARRQRQGTKPVPLRADNFVGGYSLPQEMLRLARYYGDTPYRKKMLDYALCAYLLRGDIRSFSIALSLFGIYNAQNLPETYKAALQSAAQSRQ